MITVDIVPMAKPRMTSSDKWKKRAVVQRYWAFKDEWKRQVDADFDLNYCELEFVLPMPKSWSKKKRDLMRGTHHTQKPDLDNLLKAVGDAQLKDDSGIHTLCGLRKNWGDVGKILIEEIGDELPW